MIIINIIGGLGNQMFMYAYAKALEQRGYEVKMDISGFETYRLHDGYGLDKYNISLPVATKKEVARYYKRDFLAKVLRKLGKRDKNVLIDDNLAFNKKWLEIEDDRYIIGYFQSERYFIDIRDLLLKEFAIRDNLSSYTADMKQKIGISKNSCSIHIRRGDYLVGNNINIHGLIGLEYYINSIEFLKQKRDDICFFVFSDDMEWTKENLGLQNAIFVDSNSKRPPHEDIYLMSICQDNIIANSSFSWWGAWLNQNSNKVVVAPSRWFADHSKNENSRHIICENWIRL